MAISSVGPNDAAVTFRGRARREMPSVSQAQNRFMHAVAEGDVPGVAKSVGKDFVAADQGRKIGKLPPHVKRKAKHARKHGRISERAARKLGME